MGGLDVSFGRLSSLVQGFDLQNKNLKIINNRDEKIRRIVRDQDE